MIRKCDCKHAYQDARYGVGNRVHIEFGKKVKDKESSGGYRCTVCDKNK